jgi:hypothetical protein
MSYLSQDELGTINIVSQILYSVSISGSLFCIFIFWFFKGGSFNTELVIWYSITNCINYIAYFLPYNPNEINNWCLVQSYITTTFENSSIIWTCIIGYCSFISVIRKTHLEKHKLRYRILFFILSYLIPGGMASM